MSLKRSPAKAVMDYSDHASATWQKLRFIGKEVKWAKNII